MKKGRVSLILVLSVVSAIAILVVYNNFVKKEIITESTKHLTEVYSQTKDTFALWVSRNWELMGTWKNAVETIQAEYGTDKENKTETFSQRVENYFENERLKWGFSEFLFFDDEGNCITADGEKGAMKFSEKQIQLLEDSDEHMVNGLWKGQEIVLFFLPAKDGTIYDFEYESVAVIYSVRHVMDVVNVESFDGSARCHITYSDSSCLFCDNHDSSGAPTVIDRLVESGSLSETEIAKVRDDFAKGNEGSVVFKENGRKYYLIYLPTGIQKSMMAGIVPKDVANFSMNKVQAMTMRASFLIGIMFVLIVMYYSISSRKHIINEKDSEIMCLQELFDILVENTDNVFVMFSDKTYEVEYVSPNVSKVLGILEDEPIKIHSRITDFKMDGEPVVTKEDILSVGMGQRSWSGVGYMHHKTGEVRWYKMGIYYTENSAGRKYVLAISDRTKERENNMHIQDALDVAKSANEAKSGFLSNVSHDIRTPMNAIVGLTTLLKKDYANPEKVAKYAEKIDISSKHLLGLINDVLDMSKIESGKTTLNVTKFELKSLVESVNEVVMPQTKAKKQKFIVETDANLRKEYIGDKTRISQIILNLLSNAVKYTAEGGEIGLHFYESDELPVSNNYAELCIDVTDNGCGMSKEYISTIFEPFSRENNERVESVEGAGLGMAVAKNLVDLMGGTISVESEVGRGSKFSVKIILKVEESVEAFVQEAGAESETSDMPKGIRALIAEDYELNAEILVELLNTEGVEVEVSHNGKEALEMFEKSEHFYYDFVLMDVQMPIMNGYSATKAIRELDRPDARSVFIVAMTANAFAEDVKMALDAGMNAHVAKPIDMDVLKDVMKKLMTKH